MHAVTLFFIFYLLSFSTAFKEGNPGLCEAYISAESRVNCGNDSFIIKWGYSMCLKFQLPDSRVAYSSEGLEFLDCVAPCLVDYINNVTTKLPFPSCPEIDDGAHASHFTCFDKCGFCTFCQTQMLPFGLTVDLDADEAKNVKMIADLYDSCGKDACLPGAV